MREMRFVVTQTIHSVDCTFYECDDVSGKEWFHTLVDGKLVGHDIAPDREVDKNDVFLSLSPFGLRSHKILQMMADGLADFGIYPTNKKLPEEVIKANAIAEERKEQIGYLRGIMDKVINKFVESKNG